MDNVKPTPPRRQRRLLLLLPVLLVVAVAANWGNVEKIATGKRSLRSIIYGRAENQGVSLHGWRMPADTGVGAKVVVEVFCIAGDPCHFETACLGRALGTIDPQRIGVKFTGSTPGSAGGKRQEQLKLGCDQGVAIDGKTKFSLPDPAQPGKKKVVLTSHKGGGMAADVLYVILDQELKAAYKGKGMAMTAAEFDTQLQAGLKRFTALEQALAEARAAGEKARRD